MSRRAARGGFSLIELLVAMVIGIVVVAAVASVLMASESRRRSTTFANDVGQAGTYGAYWLDLLTRSAGGGFAQVRGAFGCRLNVTRANTVILPRSTPFPAPFADIPGDTIRLAPALIHANRSQGGSDVLVLMGGAAGVRDMPAPLQAATVTEHSVGLANTIGFKGNDLVLLLAATSTSCLLEQVDSSFAHNPAASPPQTDLPLAGTYYTPEGADRSLVSYGTLDPAYLANVGNAVGNLPILQLVGVGSQRTLWRYDLLQGGGSDAALPVLDGVTLLKARYGIDSNGDGALDIWVDPALPPYDANTLLNGSDAARTSLQSIVALRVALVLQSSYPEREVISPSALTLFPDLDASLQFQVPLAADARYFRFRVVEQTIPLRNVLIPGIL